MKLAENGTLVKFRKGESIFKKDYLISDPCVYLIVEGEVELSRKFTTLQKESFVIKKGEIFGMLEVFVDGNRYTNAHAISEVQAIGFSRQEYEKNVLGNLSFALLNIRLMSRMLRELNLILKRMD